MIQNRFLFVCIILLISTTALAQKESDRNITVKITPLNNCKVYLGCYYGIGKMYADTALLDASGNGFFRSKKKLTPGLYFLISPKNQILTEFLLDSKQQFKIVVDTNNLAKATITGSPENDLFKKYITFASNFVEQTNKLDQTYKNAKSENERNSIALEKSDWGRKLDKFKDSIIHKFPKSLTALFLTAGKIPELPVGMVVKTKSDTLKAARYLKEHFWDDVSFNDDRLLYTPFFEYKIDTYFNFYVSPQADSIIKDMKYMLLYARTGKEMYPYLLNKFTNRFYSSEYVGQTKVFLCLFKDFYLKGDSLRLNSESKKLIFDRAYQLMANQVGDPAPQLDMTGMDNKPISLYNINAPYTMIVFWDPSCTHCQHELPRIDSIYRTKWKGMGLKLFSVNTNEAMRIDMVKYIASNHLDPDWIHTYQSSESSKAIAIKGQLSYLQLYDVSELPTLYLLDDKKRIIAKHLRMEQMHTLITVKENLKNDSKF